MSLFPSRAGRDVRWARTAVKALCSGPCVMFTLCRLVPIWFGATCGAEPYAAVAGSFCFRVAFFGVVGMGAQRLDSIWASFGCNRRNYGQDHDVMAPGGLITKLGDVRTRLPAVRVGSGAFVICLPHAFGASASPSGRRCLRLDEAGRRYVSSRVCTGFNFAVVNRARDRAWCAVIALSRGPNGS